MKTTTTPFNRGDSSIHNFLRMLRPILEEKELIGTLIKATELAKICRNHHRRLPLRSCRALDLADDISFMGRGNMFRFDDLDISVYMEFDPVTRRRAPLIEFQRAVSLEQQCLEEARLAQIEHEA